MRKKDKMGFTVQSPKVKIINAFFNALFSRVTR